MAATFTRKHVSLAEAADVLAVSTKTVRRYIANGHLDAVRLGRKTLRIKLDSTERFIEPGQSEDGAAPAEGSYARPGATEKGHGCSSRSRGNLLRTMHSRCTRKEKGP